LKKNLSLIFFILLLTQQAIALESHVRVRILEKYHPTYIQISYEKSIYEFEKIDLNSSFPVSFPTETCYTISIPEAGLKRDYKGSLTLLKEDNELLIINRVPMESYVASVVLSEMGPAPPEAMCAQAVISRTWAMGHINEKARYDFNDLTSSQSYQGYSSYVKGTLTTISKTEGEILTYRGDTAKILFHAQCSDRIYSAYEIWGKTKIPYLVSTPLPPESKHKSQPDSWTVTIPKSRVDDLMLHSNSRNQKLFYKVERLNGLIQINTGRTRMPIDTFRLAVNQKLGWNKLRSNDFTITQKGNDLIFSGKGFGHLVGLCQKEAGNLAQNDWQYGEILALFYPGTIIIDSGR